MSLTHYGTMRAAIAVKIVDNDLTCTRVVKLGGGFRDHSIE